MALGGDRVGGVGSVSSVCGLDGDGPTEAGGLLIKGDEGINVASRDPLGGSGAGEVHQVIHKGTVAPNP